MTTPETPDHSFIIVSLAGEMQDGLAENSEASILAFMQEAGKRLVDLDVQWGYVSVAPSTGSASPSTRKTVQLPNNQTIAADCFMYGTTFQEVHVLRDALEAGKVASPHWVLTTGLRTAMHEGGWYPINPEAQNVNA